MGSSVKKAVKCSACSMYYNGMVYSECPHCKQNSHTVPIEIPAAPAAGSENEKGSIFGMFVKKKSKTTQDHEYAPAPAPKISTTEDHTTPTYAQQGTMNSAPAEPPKGPEDSVRVEGARLTKMFQGESLFSDPQPSPSFSQEQQPTEKAAPAAEEPAAGTLQSSICRSGRTIGRFTPSGGDRSEEPVVGWLVCVKGVYFGESFKLKSGKNKVGRSHEMDVQLMNDNSVSRTCVCTVIFDSRSEVFSLMPGESDSLVYVNGDAVYERFILNGYEEIEMGDSGKNKFVFVPLCGGRFRWNNYQ